MIPTTAERVRKKTACSVNAKIDEQTARAVAEYAEAGPRRIERRLRELDAEWDIERYLETGAPTLTLTGLLLGTTKDRKWLIVSAVVQAFFLQHAIQGWCPPLIVLRRLGVRTADEINRERTALKALRGDFDMAESSPAAALAAVDM